MSPDPDAKEIAAQNVQALLDYARDRKRPYADAKSLAKKAGLTPSTIGRLLKAKHACQVDTLDAIARVYKLRAWQLLIPSLDPSNPPVVPYTDAERELYWRIKSVAQQFARTGGLDVGSEDEEAGEAARGTDGSPHADRPEPASGPKRK